MPDGDETSVLRRPHELTLYGDELAAGAVVGEYSVTATLGKGGCGIVYSAVHRVLDRPAAIKVLDRKLAQSAEVVARFIREARTVNKIRHPNIIDVFAFGSLPDGRPFFVMELLEGTDLERHVRGNGTMAAEIALEVLEPVLAALQAVHEAGFVHRDIKPSNIFLHRSDAGVRPTLLDFGVAKMIRPDAGEVGLTGIGAQIGSPAAMSPEQIRGGAVDARTDIYGVGVLLYRVLTGVYPFRSREWSGLEQMHLTASPRRPSELAAVSPAVEAIVLKCMEKDPERRFASAADLSKALRAATGGERTPESPRTTARAVAIAIAGLLDDPENEPLHEELGERLYEAQQLCEARGYRCPFQTSNSLLGARVVSDDDDSERAAALRLAAVLAAQLRASSSPGLSFQLAVHVGEVALAGDDIVGGELLRTGDWPPDTIVQRNP